MRRGGFTFVEVTAAVTIGAFVMLVAVGSMKSITGSATTVRQHSEMAAELRYIEDQLRSDLDNLFRDKKRENVKLSSRPEVLGASEYGRLTFYTVSHQRARQGQPESDVYEVEYGLMERDDQQIFTRRVWPNPDKEKEPKGLLTILSERIVAFHVRFFDGQEWQENWSEETQNLPELIEVQLAAQWDETRPPVTRTLLANYKQGSGEVELEDRGMDESDEGIEN